MKNKKPVIFLTFANDKQDDAMYLRNLPLELHNIREALQPAVQAGLCEVIERTAATVDQIFDIFQDPYYKDRIALFHYGGHASGTQLMLETLDGGHGASNSDGLVPFFGKQKGLQLIFINGCSSQEQALQMIDEGISAVVGTSQAINDSIATEISKRFYTGLASGLTIDQSWQQAIDSVKTKNNTKKTKGLKLRRDKGSDFPWNMYLRQGSEIVKDWNLPTAVNNPLFGLPKLPRNFNLPEEPYRFLHRYEAEHAEVFFGRPRYIRDLYNRSTDEHAAPVILLYGQSGVGKSSLLDAGVVPRLQRENQVTYTRRDFSIGILGTLRAALELPVELPKSEEEAAENITSNEPNLPVSDHDSTIDKAKDEAHLQEKLAPLTALLPSLDNEFKEEIETAINRILERHREEVNEINAIATEEDLHEEGASLILNRWKKIEGETGEPLIIVLDQVEEIFTKEHPDLPDELDDFFSEMSLVFDSPLDRPKGRLILSYRKEFHPEIEEACKTHQIPREQIFLKPLTKEDIQEVILGLVSTPKLQTKYQLKIEENLPEIIADDLLEDKDSAISPVLQILLTKLWNMSVEERGENDEHQWFSIDNYQALKKEGILMDDFFYQQMEKLQEWSPQLVESGLALDVLNYHTSRLGSATVQTLDDIRARYQHREEAIQKLVGKLKDLYLLTDAGLGKTGLAHDSIAPLIQDMMRTSDYAGQRAFRILRNKLPNFLLSPESIIDADDLELVEEGVGGMRLWRVKEEELIEASRKKREADRRRMLFFKRLGMAAILLIIGLSIFAGREAIKAKIQEGIAKEKTKEALVAQAEAVKQQGVAVKNAEEAKKQTQIAKEEEAKAVAERANAFRQKGLAELSEKRAIEQKGIAEAETERAEAETERAEQQTKLAKEQRARAIAGEKDATEQRGIAERKTIEVQRQLDLELSKTEADKAEDLARLDDFQGALATARESIKAFLASSGGNIKDVHLPSEVYNSLNSVYESVSNSLGNNVFVAHPHIARDLEFNGTTDRIAFSTFTDKKIGQIYLVNNEANGSQDRQILPVDDEVRTIRFSPDGRLLLAGTVDGRVLGWEYSSRNERYEGFQLFKNGHPLAPTNLENEYTAENSILSIAFAEPSQNAGYYYLAICTKKSYYIYQIDKYGRIMAEIQHENRAINYCMFSNSGKYFTITTNQGAEVYTKNDEAKKWTLYKKIPLVNATEASFSSDDAMIAIGNKKGFVNLYDLKNDKPMLVKPIHKAPLTALKFSPNNDKLITSSLDHTVKLFDIARYKKDRNQVEPITLLGSSKWVWDISFSKDEKYIYAISQDQTIRKWPTDIEELFKNIEKAKNEKLYLRNRRSSN